ncbi:helix-turn-helix domain-containing protein [Nocardia sp. NPDC058519]|uniref:helix-turn-helix domain-containing protein n=1 Tax=Nocardia sp. NPDC058519 TaxID=3346535 RepID=UPI003651EFC5
MTTAPPAPGFGPQLRRWRTLRRVSQLDLAIRAETSQRYLSFLEQGRSHHAAHTPIQPSASSSPSWPATSPPRALDPTTFPLHLHTPDGDLRLITTLTSFATAADVTIAELHLEAFLPADAETARILALRATRR